MVDQELRRQKALFAMGDVLALIGSFALALTFHDPGGAILNRIRDANPVLLLLGSISVVSLWIVVFNAFELYRVHHSGSHEQLGIIKGCTVAALLSLLLLFLSHIDMSRITVLLMYLFSLPLLVLSRALMRRTIKHVYANPSIAIPLVIIGFNPIARFLCAQIVNELNQYEFLGFIDDVGTGIREYNGHKVLSGIAHLRRLAAERPGLEAAIVQPDSPVETQEAIIRQCELSRVRWHAVPWLFRSLSAGLEVTTIDTISLIGPKRRNIEGLNFVLKRACDLTIATSLIAVTSPVMLLGAVAIWLTDGSPVFFRQTRVGIHGRPFELLKFRTMRPRASDERHREYVRGWIKQEEATAETDGDPHPIFKLTKDERITSIGRWLRRFSIDELPQLTNVLRGEMSLIGPRPALPYEIELYDDWHLRRLEAPPGITGLWQVSGRNRLSFEEMVRLDIQYINEWSLGSDLRILARTVPTLLYGSGH